VQARQLVEFVIAVAGEAIHFDGLEQAHLIVVPQRLDGHTAEFGKVSDPDHLKASSILIHPPARGESRFLEQKFWCKEDKVKDSKSSTKQILEFAST
jgi:hypothetical protein